MTSTDVVKPETNTKSTQENKNISRAGSVNGKIEFNNQYLDEFFHNINY